MCFENDNKMPEIDSYSPGALPDGREPFHSNMVPELDPPSQVSHQKTAVRTRITTPYTLSVDIIPNYHAFSRYTYMLNAHQKVHVCSSVRMLHFPEMFNSLRLTQHFQQVYNMCPISMVNFKFATHDTTDEQFRVHRVDKSAFF